MALKSSQSAHERRVTFIESSREGEVSVGTIGHCDRVTDSQFVYVVSDHVPWTGGVAGTGAVTRDHGRDNYNDAAVLAAVYSEPVAGNPLAQ